MEEKIWEIDSSADPELVKSLSAQTNLEEVLANILINRELLV